MGNLTGKVVVITGASSGIGQAVAKMAAEHGAKLVLAARREERLRELAETIKAAGGEAVYKVTDVSKKEQVIELTDFAISSFGQIDVLVNNAGIMPSGFLDIEKSDEWDALIDINIKGVLYNIGAVLPHMRARKTGHIINVSSVAAYETASPYAIVYSMAKHAVKNISEGLRQQEAILQTGIRVTDVGPGTIDTDLKYTITDPQMRAAAMQQYSDPEKMLQPEEMALAIITAMEMPEKIAFNTMVVRPVNS